MTRSYFHAKESTSFLIIYQPRESDKRNCKPRFAPYTRRIGQYKMDGFKIFYLPLASFNGMFHGQFKFFSLMGSKKEWSR
jgi:hypothetical protein